MLNVHQRKKSKGDVEWYIPYRKLPIAYSTKAVSDLITLLSKQYDTIQEVQEHINYNPEAKAILQLYIDKGFGERKASEWFR